MLSTSVGGTAYKTLSQVGITSDPSTGKLQLDNTKLQTALTNNSQAVKDLVVGDGKTTGITTNMLLCGPFDCQYPARCAGTGCFITS